MEHWCEAKSMSRWQVYHRLLIHFKFFWGSNYNNQVNGHRTADLGPGITFKMLFAWPEISHSSLSPSPCCNNEFSSWKPAERSRHCEAPWEHGAVNLLISSYLNPELINSHSGRSCCCSASPSWETKQTMDVIERRNRWHYWILITSFPRRRRTRQLPGNKTCVCVWLCKCVCVYRKGLERKGRRLAHQVLTAAERRS